MDDIALVHQEVVHYPQTVGRDELCFDTVSADLPGPVEHSFIALLDTFDDGSDLFLHLRVQFLVHLDIELTEELVVLLVPGIDVLVDDSPDGGGYLLSQIIDVVEHLDVVSNAGHEPGHAVAHHGVACMAHMPGLVGIHRGMLHDDPAAFTDMPGTVAVVGGLDALERLLHKDLFVHAEVDETGACHLDLAHIMAFGWEASGDILCDGPGGLLEGFGERECHRAREVAELWVRWILHHCLHLGPLLELESLQGLLEPANDLLPEPEPDASHRIRHPALIF